MVEAVNKGSASFQTFNDDFQSECQTTINQLKEAFPDKTVLEIEQAIADYVQNAGASHPSEVDQETMLKEISQTFKAELSTQALNEIRSEWEDMAKDGDVGVSELADVLDTYSKQGVDITDRQFMMLLFKMLQKEIEDAVGEEIAIGADSDKKVQKENLDETVEKQTEANQSKGEQTELQKAAQWFATGAKFFMAAALFATAAISAPLGIVVSSALFAAGTIVALDALEDIGINLNITRPIMDLGADIINGIFGTDYSGEQFYDIALFAIKIVTVGLGWVTLALETAASPEKLKGVEDFFTNIGKFLGLVQSKKDPKEGVNDSPDPNAPHQFTPDEIEAIKEELEALKELMETMSKIGSMDEELAMALLQAIFKAMKQDASKKETRSEMTDDITKALLMNFSRA